MPTHDDVLFSRIVIQKGLLPKETVQQALAEVDRLRPHDPELTMGQYLRLKELLPAETIEWVQRYAAALEASAPAGAGPSRTAPEAAHPPAAHARPTAHGRGPAPAHGHAPVRGHAPPAHAHAPHGHAPVHGHVPHHHPHKPHPAPRPRTPAVMVATIGGSLALAAGIVLYMNMGGSRTPAETPVSTDLPAPAPAVPAPAAPATTAAVPSPEEERAFQDIKLSPNDRDRLGLADGFLKRFPVSPLVPEITSLRDRLRLKFDGAGRAQLDEALRNRAEFTRDRKYKELAAMFRVVAGEFKGTAAGGEAETHFLETETAWKAAVRAKLAEIDGLAARKKYEDAIIAAKDILLWCPSDLKTEIENKIVTIERDRGPIDIVLKPVGEDDDAVPRRRIDREREPADPEPVVTKPDEEPTDEEATDEEPTDEEPTDEGPIDNGGRTSVPPEKKDAKKELFPKDGGEGGGPAVNPIADAVKKVGKEAVVAKLLGALACSHCEVEPSGRVKIGYAFSTVDKRLANDWKPAVGTSMTDKIRWSVRAEGDIAAVWYGVRVTDKSSFINQAFYTHELTVDVCYLSAQRTTSATHFITGLRDKKSGNVYGGDFGTQAVRIQEGKIDLARPASRGELVKAMEVHWFRSIYRDGRMTTYRAYGSEGRGAWLRSSPEWEDAPNFREGGAYDVKKNIEEFQPIIVFYPDIVGTIGLVRIYGYLSPAWIKEKGLRFE